MAEEKPKEETGKQKTLLWAVSESTLPVVLELEHLFDKVLASSNNRSGRIISPSVEDAAKFINAGNFSKIVLIVDVVTSRGPNGFDRGHDYCGYDYVVRVAEKLNEGKKADLFLIRDCHCCDFLVPKLLELADYLSKIMQSTVEVFRYSDGRLPAAHDLFESRYEEKILEKIRSLIGKPLFEPKEWQKTGHNRDGELQMPAFKKNPVEQAKPQKIKAG